MKTKSLRLLAVLAVLVLIGAGFVVGPGVGTLSAIGWGDISLLCPLGALGTMLASKMVIPRAVISLVVAVAAIIILGRAFCAWACPVPVVSKLRDTFKPKNARESKAACGHTKRVSSGEKPGLSGCSSDCASCGQTRSKVDSRHFVLGGALLSAAVFGFPVFCLVCPIGLTFATILLVVRLFGHGDMSWTVILIPALLFAEVVFFRKWCTRICPLGALMGLIGKANKTFRPAIDDTVCIETSKGAQCGKCATVCEVGIDPRHPERGASWGECTKCRDCVDACPVQAITMPIVAPSAAKPSGVLVKEEAGE